MVAKEAGGKNVARKAIIVSIIRKDLHARTGSDRNFVVQ